MENNDTSVGFIYLPSFHRAIRSLPDEIRLPLYDAVTDYGVDGLDADSLSGVSASIFALIKPNINASKNRYASSVNNGRKGGRPTKNKPNENPDETQPEPKGKPNENQEKDKEKDKDRDKEKERERDKDKAENVAGKPPPPPRFVAPSVDEVKAYCLERGCSVNAERFVDFYGSKGWRVGNSTMSDWKACVRTWEGRETERKSIDDRNRVRTASDYDGEGDFFA